MTDSGGRILGLDYGARTVGTALSDPLFLTAQPLEIIRRKEETHHRSTLRRLAEIVSTYDVRLIVLGLPLNMDDSVGERAVKTLTFRDILEARLSLPVVMQDERLTSVTAEEVMRESGVRREDYGKYVDSIAAAIILQDYLNAHERKDSGDN
jgi:putative Holliday junction resolvase